MNSIQIDEVKFLDDQKRSQLAGFSLNHPKPCVAYDGFLLEFLGWIAGSSSKTTRLIIASVTPRSGGAPDAMWGGHRPLIECGIVHERPDVVRHPAYSKVHPVCGFQCFLNVAALPDSFALALSVVLENGTTIRWAILRGRHTPFCPAYKTSIAPLMVNFLGRSGSTWMMHLLAQHPRIATSRTYPYEDLFAQYWLKTFKVLSQPGSAEGVGRPNKLGLREVSVQPNPYLGPSALADPGLRRWFEGEYLQRLAEYCLRNVETIYSALAAIKGRQACAYFAEKYPIHNLLFQELTCALFPVAREIILLRDPRDVLCSIISFNRKRGYDGFGIDDFEKEVDFVGFQFQQNARLLRRWRTRGEKVLLVRYEELIAHPVEVVLKILGYLGFDDGAATAEEMVRRASAPDPAMANHQTLSDPAASVGRWRRELSPAQQQAYRDIFGDLLRELGYDA